MWIHKIIIEKKQKWVKCLKIITRNIVHDQKIEMEIYKKTYEILMD